MKGFLSFLVSSVTVAISIASSEKNHFPLYPRKKSERKGRPLSTNSRACSVEQGSIDVVRIVRIRRRPGRHPYRYGGPERDRPSCVRSTCKEEAPPSHRGGYSR